MRHWHSLLQAALMANTEVLKEPRGFIKFIEIVSKLYAISAAINN